MSLENLGFCYELGYKFQQVHPEYILVHGYITNQSFPYQTIDHCWCMQDDIVYDATTYEEFTWEFFEKNYGAEIEWRYTAIEAKEMALKYGRPGGWHEIRKFESDKYYNDDGSLKKEFRDFKGIYDKYLTEHKSDVKNILSYDEYKDMCNKQIEENLKYFDKR